MATLDQDLIVDYRPVSEKPRATTKIPPHSIEAEQSVLGALMLDHRAWDNIADCIGPADFYRNDHRAIFDAIIKTTKPGSLVFKFPPYEYEYRLMPFDILSGDSGMREVLLAGNSLKIEKERWAHETDEFRAEFGQIAAYDE